MITIPKEFIGYLPEIPDISKNEIKKCKENNNFMPIAFKWSKFCGIMSIRFASITLDSPSINRQIDDIHIIILQGLLNRCSRLLMSIMHLASANKFDETIRIIFRCLMETIIKIEWLTINKNNDAFTRYIADGLKSDLVLKKLIEKNIFERDGKTQIIEERMLNSIRKCVNNSGMTEKQVTETKKMPNFYTICSDTGNDKTYITIQRMGSHAIHGTFTDLLFHYLENNDGVFSLKDNTDKPKDSYLTTPCLFLTIALEKYSTYIFDNLELISELKVFLKDVRMQIFANFNDLKSSDFDYVN